MSKLKGASTMNKKRSTPSYIISKIQKHQKEETSQSFSKRTDKQTKTARKKSGIK